MFYDGDSVLSPGIRCKNAKIIFADKGKKDLT